MRRRSPKLPRSDKFVPFKGGRCFESLLQERCRSVRRAKDTEVHACSLERSGFELSGSDCGTARRQPAVMKTITESRRQEVQKRYCRFESIPLRHTVSGFSDTSENRSKSARVRAICDQICQQIARDDRSRRSQRAWLSVAKMERLLAHTSDGTSARLSWA